MSPGPTGLDAAHTAAAHREWSNVLLDEPTWRSVWHAIPDGAMPHWLAPIPIGATVQPAEESRDVDCAGALGHRLHQLLSAGVRMLVWASADTAAATSLLGTDGVGGYSLTRRRRVGGGLAPATPGVLLGTGPVDGLLDQAMSIVPPTRTSARQTAPFGSLHVEAAAPDFAGIGDWLCTPDGWVHLSGRLAGQIQVPCRVSDIRVAVLTTLTCALTSVRAVRAGQT